MLSTTLTCRIRRTALAAVLGLCLSAPAAFADSWGRDFARAQKSQPSDVLDRYFANQTRSDLVDRYIANNATPVHDEHFVPLASGAQQPSSTSDSGTWIALGGGAGATLVLAATGLLVVRTRRVVHS